MAETAAEYKVSGTLAPLGNTGTDNVQTFAGTTLGIGLSGLTPTGGSAGTMTVNLGAIIGPIIVAEQIFGWPGLGSLLISSIIQSDYNTVVAIFIMLGRAPTTERTVQTGTR